MTRNKEEIIACAHDLVTLYGPRNEQYRLNWHAYKGEYDKITGVDMRVTGGRDSRNRRDNSFQVWNLTKPIVHASVMQLSRLPEILVPTPQMGIPEADMKAEKTEDILYCWWDKVNMVNKHSLMGMYLAVFGTSVQFVRPDQKRKLPQMLVRKPETCYPMPKGEGEREYEYVIFRWLMDEAQAAAAWPQVAGKTKNLPGYGKQVEVIEYIDETDYVVIVGEHEATERIKHNFGFCPVTITPAVNTGEIFGPSDIDQLIAINIYLNALQTKLGDALEENLYAQTWVKSDDPKPVNTGPGAVNYIGRDDDVVRLPPISIPPELFHQVEKVEDFMRTHAIWPEIMSGEASGSVVTGRAMSRLMGPSTGMAAIRQMYMGADLQKCNAWALAMLENLWADEEFTWYMASPLTVNAGPKKSTKYSTRFIPSEDLQGYYENYLYYSVFGSDLNQATVAALQLQGAGIISKQWIRNQLPGLHDAEGMAKEIEQEKKEEMALEVSLQAQLQELQTQSQMQQMQAQAAMQGQAPGGAAPEGGPPAEGAPAPQQGGLPPGEQLPSSLSLLPGGAPTAMGTSAPLSGEENFPLPFTEVKPYAAALDVMTGTPQPPEKMGAGAVSAEDVMKAVAGVQKLKGEVYLAGEIAKRGQTMGAITLALTDKLDKQTLLNALPEYKGRIEFVIVPAGQPPAGAIPIVGETDPRKEGLSDGW
jgi:hypothetical protein